MGLAESGPADSVVAYFASDERSGGARALPENCEWILRIAATLGKLQRLRGIHRFSRATRETEGRRRGGGVHQRQFARGRFDCGDEEGQTCFLPEAAHAYNL